MATRFTGERAAAALAFEALRAQPARSALAILGVVIGIVTVVIVASTLVGLRNSVATLFRQVYAGGSIEAVTNYCTHRLADRLTELDIPATYSFRNSGTHSWGYWNDDFHDSWPVLAGSLGL